MRTMTEAAVKSYEAVKKVGYMVGDLASDFAKGMAKGAIAAFNAVKDAVRLGGRA